MTRVGRKAERLAFDRFNDLGRGILARHDLLGLISDGMPDDEYDCVLTGVMVELRSDREASLGTWMAVHFVEHFGMTPDVDEVTAAAAELTTLWHTDELAAIRA